MSGLLRVSRSSLQLLPPPLLCALKHSFLEVGDYAIPNHFILGLLHLEGHPRTPGHHILPLLDFLLLQ